MAKLTSSDIEKTARLANLPLSDSEIFTYQEQLSQIVDFVSQLEEVDTSSIEPTSQTTGLVNVTRKDEIDVTRVLTQDEALSNSDKTHNGYFVVPMLLTNKDE